jgi:autotransporter-associated beta strand protein/T5SS/PEP-CTERM-associated repeat protein
MTVLHRVRGLFLSLTFILGGYATLSSSRAADVSWITTGSGNFATGSNWSSGTVPTSADLAIIGNGGTATLTLAGTSAAARLSVGQDGAGTLVILGGGTATTSGVSYVGRTQTIGASGGNGTLVLDGSSTLRHTTSGELFIGVGSGTRGVAATMTVNAGSLYDHASGGNVVIGQTNGSGTAQFAGTLNLVGGTFAIASNELVVGQRTSGAAAVVGTVSISDGGSLTVNNWTKFGGGGGTGRLLISGGSFTKGGTGNLMFGDFSGRGEVTQTGGTLTNTAGTLQIGAWGVGGVGVYDISSGTLASTTTLTVGSNNGNGTLNVTGGVVRKSGAGDLEAGTGASGRGTINVSGGLVDVQVGDLAIGAAITGTAADGGRGVLNMSGGGEVRAGRIVLGKTHVSASGTVNLSGGTLRVNQVSGGAGGGGSAFVFNGGTLAARADQTSFMAGIGSAAVTAGGAVFDTAGFAVTVPQVLSGSGAVTKIGAGTLSLTGANTFSGPVTVSGGKLIATTSSAAAVGSVTLSASTTLGVTVTGGLDTQFTASSLALGSSSGLTIDLASFGNPSVAPLNVSGALTTSGASTINFLSTAPTVGTIPLVTYGSLNAFTFTLGTLPAGVLATLSNNTASKSIDLVVTSVSLPRWDGGISDVWNVAGTANWVNTLTGTATTFQNGNPALFNDLAAGPTDVQLNSTVLPGTTTFANETRAYSLGGSGAINGTGGLTKQGAASLSLNTVNGYTGVTRLEGGTTSISIVANAGSPSALGAASADPSNLVFAGGALAYAGSSASTTRGFTIGGSNSVIDVTGAATVLTVSGNVAASAGQFRKIGPGTLVLAGTANTLGADTTAYAFAVDAGTLRIGGTAGAAASRVNTVTGELRVGSLTDSSATLEVTNATVNVSGWLSVGHGQGGSGQTAAATLTNATVQAANVRLGYDNALPLSATQSLTLANSSVSVANEALIGNSAGSGAALSLQGASTFSTSGNLILGNVASASGTATVANSSRLAAGDGLYVGDSGTGELALLGSSTAAAGRLLIGQASGGIGSMSAGDDARIDATVYAAVGNFGSGSLSLRDRARMAVTYDLNVADRFVSSGTLTIQDRASVTAGSVYVAKGANSVGSLVISGGTIAAAANGTFAIGRNGTGALAVSGSGVVVTGTSGLVLAVNAANAGNPDEAAAGVGSLDLNGGFLETTVIRKGLGSTATMTLNGGTIRAASGASAAFMTGLDNAVVLPGGVTFDTNGQSIAIGQSLADGGGGGIVKLGSGTLSLTGLNTYTGANDVVAGKLAVQTTSLASGGYSLADGTRLGVMIGGSGTQLSAASVTMTGTTGLDIDFASFGNPTLAPLNVLGILTAGGPVTITVSGVQPAVGQIPLIQYASKTGAGSYSLAPLTGYTASLVDDGTTIFLNVTGIAARQWNGLASGTPAGAWNVGTTANWLIPPTTASAFANGDAAVFNDSAAGTTDVVVAAAVSPASVTIDNASLAYTFTGPGAISGTASLRKQGAGNASISTANTYTGVTTVAGGRLAVGSLANGGAASPIGASSSAATNLVLAGGTLSYTGVTATVNRGFSTVGTGGGLEVTSPGTTLTLSGNVSGTGTLAVSGSGTLRLTGTSIAAGSGAGDALAVRSGTLVLAGGGTGAASQTSSFSGEVVVGSAVDSGAALTVTDATLNATGFLSVGRGTGATAANSTVTVTRGAITASGLAIGSDGGVTPNLATQTVTVLNSSLASGGDSLIGDSAGSTAALVLSGSSSFTSDNGTRIGNAAGAVGSLIVANSSSFTTAGWLAIGNSGSGSFTARDAAVVTVPVDFNVADLDGSTGSLEIRDTASVSAASTYLAKNGASFATATISGGTFAATGSEFIIGRTGSAGWSQSGGTTTATSEVVLGRNGGSTGSLSVSGGSFAQTGTASGLIVGFDGIGTLTVSGSGSVTVAGTASGLTLGNFGIGAGTVSLDGGTLTVPYVRKAGTTAGMTFNGGVLRAGSGARNDFLSGLDSATVLAGGAAIDTNGASVTISQALIDGGVGGGLVKQGAGTLVLGGANTYTGVTSVAAGTLSLSAAGSVAASSAVMVAAGAVFDVSSQASGYAVPATQTLGGSGTVNGGATFAAGATVSPGTSPGTLTFTQGVTFGTGGNYTWQLLNASGTAGTSWDLVSTTGALTVAATSLDPFAINLWTLSSILPDVSGSAAGFNAGQSFSWRIASAAGGISGFAADKFAIRTSATNGTGGFANAYGSGTFSIAQSGNDLNLVFTSGGGPSVITINVASGTQTQGQAGYPTLSGSVPVVKTGGGTLVLDQANTLTGSTTVQGGVVRLANTSALSASRLVVVAGGTGQLAPFATTAVAGLDLATGNGLMDVTNGSLTILGGMTAPELVAELLEGRGDGSWNGTSGITSSTAAADIATSQPRSVGWLDNGDGTFTVAYAAPGDTNIDWAIDILDASNFLALGKFDTGLPATWVEGDFSYDGIVDILDAADFFATGLYDAGTYNSASGAAGVAAVPEPGMSMIGAVVLGLGVILQVRRQRRHLSALTAGS